MAEYSSKLTIDTSQFSQQLDSILNILTNVQGKLGGIGKVDDSGVTKLNTDLEKTKSELSNVSEGAKKASSSISDFGKGFLGGAIATAATGFVKDLFEGTLELSRIQKQAEQKVEQVIKSTGGAAGVSLQEAKDLASSLQQVTNFGDETTLSAEHMLLTFTNIGKDIFPQATETVLNLATAMGTDTKNSAIQLGKALNDPEKGIGALTRVGVTFTAQQKEQIKAMQDAGNIAGAQKIILGELDKEFGGLAKSTADPFTQMKNALGDVKEKIGDLLGVLIDTFGPVIKGAIGVLDSVFSGLKDHMNIVKPILIGASVAIAVLAGSILVSLIPSLYASVAGWVAFAVAEGVALGPITLIALGIGALIAIVVGLTSVFGDQTEAQIKSNDAALALNDTETKTIENKKKHADETLSLVDRYKQLGEMTNRTAAQQAEYTSIISQLNEAYPGVNAKADDFNGSLERIQGAAQKTTGDVAAFKSQLDTLFNQKENLITIKVNLDAKKAGKDLEDEVKSQFQGFFAGPQTFDEGNVVKGLVDQMEKARNSGELTAAQAKLQKQIGDSANLSDEQKVKFLKDIDDLSKKKTEIFDDGARKEREIEVRRNAEHNDDYTKELNHLHNQKLTTVEVSDATDTIAKKYGISTDQARALHEQEILNTAEANHTKDAVEGITGAYNATVKAAKENVAATRAQYIAQLAKLEDDKKNHKENVAADQEELKILKAKVDASEGVLKNNERLGKQADIKLGLAKVEHKAKKDLEKDYNDYVLKGNEDIAKNEEANRKRDKDNAVKVAEDNIKTIDASTKVEKDKQQALIDGYDKLQTAKLNALGVTVDKSQAGDGVTVNEASVEEQAKKVTDIQLKSARDARDKELKEYANDEAKKIEINKIYDTEYNQAYEVNQKDLKDKALNVIKEIAKNKKDVDNKSDAEEKVRNEKKLKENNDKLDEALNKELSNLDILQKARTEQVQETLANYKTISDGFAAAYNNNQHVLQGFGAGLTALHNKEVAQAKKAADEQMRLQNEIVNNNEKAEKLKIAIKTATGDELTKLNKEQAKLQEETSKDATASAEITKQMLSATLTSAAEGFAGLILSGKATLGDFIGVALDALQALVPIIVAQITGYSLASPQSVASFGAAGLAEAAILTGLFEAAIAVAKAAAIKKLKGGEISGSGLSGLQTGGQKWLTLNEDGRSEYVVNAGQTHKYLGLLEAINSGSIDKYINRKDYHSEMNIHSNKDIVDALKITNSRLDRIEKAQLNSYTRMGVKVDMGEMKMKGDDMVAIMKQAKQKALR